MKKTIKLMSLVLAMVMCFGCFSVAVSAAGNPAVTLVEITKLADLQNKITDGYTGTTQHTSWNADGYVVEYDITVHKDCYLYISVMANNLVKNKSSDKLNFAGALYSAGYSNTYIKFAESVYNAVAINDGGYAFVNAGKYTLSLKADGAEEDITVYAGILPADTAFTSVEYLSSNENSVTVKINTLDKVEKLYVYNGKYGYNSTPQSTGEIYTLDPKTNTVTLPFGKDKDEPENTNKRYPFFSYKVVDIFGFDHVEHFAVFCDATIETAGIVNATYTGKTIKQSGLNVKVVGNASPSYKVTYKNNVNAGTATMQFEGTGEWIGSLTRTFKINPIKAEKCSVSLSSTSYTYDGKTKKPSVTVKWGSKVLKEGTDYTVTYSSGLKNVGKYGVKVTFKGNYTGSKTMYFSIVPKGTSLSSVTAGTKKLTPKWTKQATQTTGYQIQYSTKSDFSGAKTLTVTKNSSVTSTISGLKAGTKYYVRIRTYKTVKFNGSNVNLYSSWSKAKSAKTK